MATHLRAIDKEFEEADDTGVLVLSGRNLRTFPTVPGELLDFADVFEAGQSPLLSSLLSLSLSLPLSLSHSHNPYLTHSLSPPSPPPPPHTHPSPSISLTCEHYSNI